MKQTLYSYYLKFKRQTFIRKQLMHNTVISPDASGFMTVKFEGENAVPSKCSFSGNVYLGFRTTLGIGNLIGGDVRIGKYCQLGTNVAIHGTNHPISYLSTYINRRLFHDLNKLKTSKEINIGNDVWIGQSAIILSGVTIGNGAIIAAGSVVTRDVAAFTIVAGNPAKPIRKRFSDEIILEIENLKWWDKSDAELNQIKSLFYKDFANAKSIFD